MNPLLLLDSVVVAVKDRVASGTGRWYLCWHNDGLMAWPTGLSPTPIEIFGTFNEDDARKGFTTNQWDALTKSLIKFYERKGKIPCPQKPSPQTKLSALSTTSTPRKGPSEKKTKPSATN